MHLPGSRKEEQVPSLDDLMADLSEMILGLPDGLPSEKRQQVVPFPFKPGEYQQ